MRDTLWWQSCPRNSFNLLKSTAPFLFASSLTLKIHWFCVFLNNAKCWFYLSHNLAKISQHCHNSKGIWKFWHRRRSGNEHTMQRLGTARFVVIELPSDVKRSDKADEAEAHSQDNCGTDLQTRSIVCIESQHISITSESAATAAASWRGCSPLPQAWGWWCCCTSSRPQSSRPRSSSSRCTRATLGYRRRRLTLRSFRHPYLLSLLSLRTEADPLSSLLFSSQGNLPPPAPPSLASTNPNETPSNAILPFTHFLQSYNNNKNKLKSKLT